MLHDWFMSFGGLAMLFTVLAFLLTKAFVKRHPAKNADDRQGNAFLTIFVGIVAIAVLVVAFFLSCFGVAATIPGWIGCALLGAAFGLLTAN